MFYLLTNSIRYSIDILYASLALCYLNYKQRINEECVYKFIIFGVMVTKTKLLAMVIKQIL